MNMFGRSIKRIFVNLRVEEKVTKDGQEVTKYYNKLNTTISVTVSDTTYSEANAVEVINRKGFELPATGSTGTIIMIAAGFAIMSF